MRKERGQFLQSLERKHYKGSTTDTGEVKIAFAWNGLRSCFCEGLVRVLSGSAGRRKEDPISPTIHPPPLFRLHKVPTPRHWLSDPSVHGLGSGVERKAPDTVSALSERHRRPERGGKIAFPIKGSLSTRFT